LFYSDPLYQLEGFGEAMIPVDEIKKKFEKYGEGCELQNNKSSSSILQYILE